MLKQNVKEFIKKLFIRYNDDTIFKDKVDKLINELDGYSVVVLNKLDDISNEILKSEYALS